MITATALGSVLNFLMQATVKGSLMILLVAALNALIGRRVDARWRHLLWVIVLLRLAMPAAPQSRWSVFNLIPAGERVVHTAGAVTVERVSAGGPVGSGQAEALSVRPLPLVVFARWIAAIWFLGLLALGLRTLIATLRTRRAVAKALRNGAGDPLLLQLLVEGRERLGIRRAVAIVESDAVRTPALHGVFRPVLLLPIGMTRSFSIEELRYVILHELWHLRRMDVAVSWALSAVQTLHWFNPLVWFAASRIKEERELACDELALSCLEEDERYGYGRTILKLLGTFRTAAPVPALVGIVNGKQKMKRRLTMIASFRNRTRFSMLFLLIVAAVGAAALTDAPGGEQRMILRHADPASLATVEHLGQRVTLDVTNASFADLLNAVSNASGLVIAQSPDIATLPVQQARFSIKAENVPVHAVLMQALMPFELTADPTANGVTINKGGENCMVIAHGAVRRESTTESTENGQKRIEKRVVVMRHAGDAAEAPEATEENAPAGAETHRVMMRATMAAGGACKFDENGKLHREVTLTMNDNGTESTGKMTLDISKQ